MTELKTNQRRAIEALLSQPTIRDAAKASDLGETTLYRYLREDAFKTELRQRQDEIITATTAALVGLSGEAVETLRNLLEDKEAPPSVKARVALGWLQHTRETLKLSDLADRVQRLEETLSQ